MEVLKMHHPCFFDYFHLIRTDDGFLPDNGLFFLYQSGDIFFEPHDASFVGRQHGIVQNSMPGPSSNTGRQKRFYRTIGSES